MPEPLRILVAADVPPNPDAGASGTVFQMNLALRRMGHIVDEIWQAELGRRIQHGNLHYLLELPASYKRALRAHLARTDYDVIEFNQPHAYLAAAYYRKLGKAGVFVNRSHGHEVRVAETLDPWRKTLGIHEQRGIRRVLSRGMRYLLHRQWNRITKVADGFHVSCTEDAEFLVERYGLPRNNIAVIPQGIPDAFRASPPHPMTEARLKRVLYVGQFSFVKAPILLAQAVSQLLTARRDVTMTWVCGTAHHSEIRALLDPDILARVTFDDWRPQDKLISIYDSHGIFLFPSFFEGFGKAPLEAMSRGLCVVASATGGMRDFVDDGSTGKLVPVGRIDLMIQETLALMDNPAACSEMSIQARAAATNYTWDRCARDLTMFYRRLLSCHRLSTEPVAKLMTDSFAAASSAL